MIQLAFRQYKMAFRMHTSAGNKAACKCPSKLSAKRFHGERTIRKYSGLLIPE